MSILARLAAVFRGSPDPASVDDAVIADYELHATLQLRTPLAWLSRHGERCASRSLPAVDPMHAIWLPRTRSWRELGLDIDDVETPSTCASDLGQLTDDEARVYLRFLRAFRGIVESDAPSAAHVERLHDLVAALRAEHPSLSARLDPRFPATYFEGVLAEDLPGVGAVSARKLVEAGLRTPAEVRGAADADLLAAGLSARAVRALQKSG